MKTSTVLFASPTTGAHSLAVVREDVDTLLNAHYQQQAVRGQAVSADYEFLWQTLKHQNQAGGKRLRPYLCILAYEALGGQQYNDILPVAAGLELLHTAMLIHDDIIDRDYSRRNKPNVAGLYQVKYATLTHAETEKNHFANSAALLAGDVALSDSYQLVLNSGITDRAKIMITKLIGDAVYNVVGGELLDSEAALYPLERANSLKIAELKTAQYSFAAPLMAGAILADAPEVTTQQLALFGVKLGIAFQLADDLLGVFGDASETGKTTIGDIREGKRTYLLQQTMQRASADQRDVLASIVGNARCEESMAKQVRQIMTDCGAKAETERLMRAYAEESEQLLASLDLRDVYNRQFKDFIQRAVWRKR